MYISLFEVTGRFITSFMGAFKRVLCKKKLGPSSNKFKESIIGSKISSIWKNTVGAAITLVLMLKVVRNFSSFFLLCFIQLLLLFLIRFYEYNLPTCGAEQNESNKETKKNFSIEALRCENSLCD